MIAYNDPVLYLYTGRHSISRPLPPYIWYSSDHARAVELYRDVAPYALQHGVGYVYFTTKDMRRDMDADDVVDIETAIRSNPRLTPVFRYGIGTIYRVDAGRGDAAEPLRPSTAYTTAPATTMTSPGQVVAGR